jgi:DNA-binding GntR family transcriptional regulator
VTIRRQRGGSRASSDLLDDVRRAIVHGDLLPGQRLVEADLAVRFQATRAAIREALVQLESEGLVERQRNRGASVRPISLEEAIEITEARAVLEGLCAAKAAAVITDDERERLRQLGRDMQRAVDDGDVVAYSDLTQELHVAIRMIAAQRTVAALLDRLRYQSVRHIFSVGLLPGRPAVGLKEHLAVIEAISSGDPNVAEAAMREHLMSVVDALRQIGERPMPFDRTGLS